MIVERKNSFKKNKIEHLKIKSNKFERLENFKYLGVILNEDNNNQTDLQERIKNANKTYFMLQKFFKNKNISKKLKLRLKNTIIDKMLTLNSLTWKIWWAPDNASRWQMGYNSAFKGLTYSLETWTLTKRDRKQLNIFESKVYRRI
jgi:outer membrane usher protein FimD/PapC